MNRYISSDTNIWLDFNAISKTDLPFRLPYTYIMYKEAMREEIIDPPKLLDELVQRGLQGVELTTEEFYYAAELSSKYVKLSGYDRIALAIAKFRNITLLTGDGALRKAAKAEGVDVIGTIGILDRLFDEDYISKTEYLLCLNSLLADANRRLPINELKKRISSFE